MKIIDKHLLRSLLAPLAYCFSAFLLVFMVFDLFENLSHFVEAGTATFDIVRYYGLLLPSMLVYIAPISMLLAALYSLSRLTRHNEITALRACGISMVRIVMPFLAVGLVGSLFVALVHETVGPWSAFWSHQFIQEQRQQDAPLSVYVAQNLAFRNEKEQRVWLISHFDTRTYDMSRVEVIEQTPEGLDRAKIRAGRARWLDGRWWFEDLIVQDYGPQGHPMGAPRFERYREMRAYTETPQIFLKEVKGPEHLSSRDLADFLRTRRNLSEAMRARVLVDYHFRLAMPWTCLVVMLMGIPFGTQSGRRGATLGIVLALSLFFAYYISLNFSMALGKKEWLWPWLAAWGPNVFFFTLGSVLVARMR